MISFRRGKPRWKLHAFAFVANTPGSHSVAHHPFKQGLLPPQGPRFISKVIFLSIILILFLLLIFIPTGFEGALQFKDAVKCKVLVNQVDNSSLIDTGLIRTGQQVCKVRFLSGEFKGQEAEGWNMLSGSLAQDKLFIPGDKAQAIVHHDEGEIISVNLIDYYRLNGELILTLAFAAFLIIFARGVGFRSVLSFFITILTLWKILIPLFLKGYNPIITGLIAVAIITFIILALVYGFDLKLLSSFCGSMSGILFAMILSIICSKTFHIHGAVMHNSEALLYSGFQDLNLTQIFMASVCIGASGSVMDLSVDITSAVSEVVRNCPTISRKEAIKSGFIVARAAMGTMTTTLLLAYAGTCTAMLMTFMAQGTPLYNILNNNVVAAEIINTLAGSFGLAMTAPLTALIAGTLLTKKSDFTKA
ncbi:MAG: YibE/F family protein [Treponema sp.]|nr:YibE/F family protein [Treponema sp.]